MPEPESPTERKTSTTCPHCGAEWNSSDYYILRLSRPFLRPFAVCLGCGGLSVKNGLLRAFIVAIVVGFVMGLILTIGNASVAALCGLVTGSIALLGMPGLARSQQGFTAVDDDRRMRLALDSGALNSAEKAALERRLAAHVTVEDPLSPPPS